jgi:hypothetical protein
LISARETLRVPQSRWQHRDRHLASELGILGAIQLTHSALTELGRYLEVRECRADQGDRILSGVVPSRGASARDTITSVLVRGKLTGVGAALGAAAFLGALSTAGDLIWASYIPDGAIVPGVVHGVIIFVALAVSLGRGTGRRGATRYLLLRLPLAGLVIAALFYPLAYVVGYLPALIVSWVVMWLALAIFLSRARGGGEAFSVVLARALVAAITSGFAFWAISGIWTDADPESIKVFVRFLQWTLAFLPGFAALLVRSKKRSPPV